MNSETSAADDAFWQAPETPYEITYSLTLFHEIDFAVNEAFRRIPHGGIEIGGVLYGTAEGNRLCIRAFRPIECAHASGPSFTLSESEVSKLAKQVSEPVQDADLSGLSVVGWFIAHTRTPLILSERERGIFDQIFSGPGKITVLVKPERFQPTRFGFLVRNDSGSTPTDASGTAIILPFPERSGPAANEPVPSPPAPASPPPAATENQPSETRESDLKETTRARKTSLLRPDSVAQHEFPLSPTLPAAPVAPTGNDPHGGTERTRELPARPRRNIRETSPQSTVPAMGRSATGSGAQFAVVLLIAALLGCCVGYWAYLQLPSPVIPLSVRAQPTGLVLLWPADQTRTVSYAALRVNDGDPVMLSASERALGEATLSANGDEIKIELIAQHWLRDSRGIVRYVKGRSAP